MLDLPSLPLEVLRGISIYQHVWDDGAGTVFRIVIQVPFCSQQIVLDLRGGARTPTGVRFNGMVIDFDVPAVESCPSAYLWCPTDEDHYNMSSSLFSALLYRVRQLGVYRFSAADVRYIVHRIMTSYEPIFSESRIDDYDQCQLTDAVIVFIPKPNRQNVERKKERPLWRRLIDLLR